jgi:hypothetical protein
VANAVKDGSDPTAGKNRAKGKRPKAILSWVGTSAQASASGATSKV